MNEEAASALFDLTGKVALITGGAGDIARVYASGLAEAGASIVLADLDPTRAEAAAESLKSEGVEALGIGVDITDEDAAARMADVAAEAFGGIDILINNAALMTELPRVGLLDLSKDWFERTMRVNTMGAWICTKAVVPSMLSRGGGRIVNGSSAAGFSQGGVYGISKYAMHSLTVNLAYELGPRGINVNSIAPGFIQSDSSYRAMAEDDPLRQQMAAAIPGKSQGPPRDLVGTLLLLVSPAGEWINGQTLHVDGGWVTRM